MQIFQINQNIWAAYKTSTEKKSSTVGFVWNKISSDISNRQFNFCRAYGLSRLNQVANNSFYFTIQKEGRGGLQLHFVCDRLLTWRNVDQKRRRKVLESTLHLQHTEPNESIFKAVWNEKCNLQGQIAYAKLNCLVKKLSTNIGAVH